MATTPALRLVPPRKSRCARSATRTSRWSLKAGSDDFHGDARATSCSPGLIYTLIGLPRQ